MSTDSWRVLEEEDVQFFKHVHIDSNFSSAFVNGVYYWQVIQSLQLFMDYKILAFHLGIEVFQLMKSPISGHGKLLPFHNDRISFWGTGTIGRNERSNQIWVLNDEGHWTKLLKIDPLLKVERMFGFWKNDKVFIESESGRLLLYDLDTRNSAILGLKPRKLGILMFTLMRRVLLLLLESSK
ncbi:hypothetical protein REPUB_Repub13aG0064200 [Reevesia pubescens]